MEIPCGVALQLLQARLDGPAPGVEAQAHLDGHLRACPSCAEVAEVAALPPPEAHRRALRPDAGWRVRALYGSDPSPFGPADLAFMAPLGIDTHAAGVPVRFSHAAFESGFAHVYHSGGEDVALLPRGPVPSGRPTRGGSRGVAVVPWDGGPTLRLDAEAVPLGPSPPASGPRAAVSAVFELPEGVAARPLVRYGEGPWSEAGANHIRLAALVAGFSTRAEAEMRYDPDAPLGWSPDSPLPAVLADAAALEHARPAPARSVLPDPPTPALLPFPCGVDHAPVLLAAAQHPFTGGGSAGYRRENRTIELSWTLHGRWAGAPAGVRLPAPVLWQTRSAPESLAVSPVPAGTGGVQPVGLAFDLADGLTVVVHHLRAPLLQISVLRAGRPTDEVLALQSRISDGIPHDVRVRTRLPGGAVYALTGTGGPAAGSTAPMRRWSDLGPFELVVAGVGRVLPPLTLAVGRRATLGGD